MVFEKRNFMGIGLDVLVGHPEHDLLFIATQIAKAAGLKNPKVSVQYQKAGPGNLQVKDLKVQESCTLDILKASGGVRWRESWLFPESSVYRMLMRGSTEKAQAFQAWLAEEVVPSIRKTGKYNAAESDHPMAQGIMDRLMSLEGVVLKQNAMLEQMQEALGKFAHAENAFVPAEPSPYEGQTMIALCDPAGFNARTYRELAEYLPRPAVDKLEGRVVLHMEVELGILLSLC